MNVYLRKLKIKIKKSQKSNDIYKEVKFIKDPQL
jgi:hypothetical protein